MQELTKEPNQKKIKQLIENGHGLYRCSECGTIYITDIDEGEPDGILIGGNWYCQYNGCADKHQ